MKPPSARRKPARTPPRGFRLLDGVVIGATALLGLKALAFLAESPPAPPADGLPAFGRVLAHARSNYLPGAPDTTGSVPDKKEEPPAAPPAAAAPPEPRKAAEPERAISAAERAILERLGDRREELQQKARDMETRERLLEESEKRLDAKRDSLKADEDKKAAATSPAAAESAALKNLVTMYETMKPKEAARVFERLPQDVLVPVVRAMNARKMAEVLAAMSPEAAEKLTVALARRDRPPAVADAAQAGLPAGELPAIALPRPAARR